MKTRNLLLGILALVLVLFCASALADTTSGTDGNIAWQMDDEGVLYLSGTGTMNDYDDSNPAPWGKTCKTAVICDGVTSVGNNAFAGCSSLQAVRISDGVTRIGKRAFYQCTALNSMTSSKGETPPEADPVTAFVKRCYSLIMNRDADAAGLTDWVTKLQNKTSTASEIIYGFMYSEEFIKRNLTNEEAVEILYKTMLNRASDAAGKADWVFKLSDGYENLDIINGFCGSKEFIALCEVYGIEPGKVELDKDPDSVAAFVRRCYRLILKRGADDVGLTDWVNNLKSGAKTASEIIHGFMYSNEFINRKMSDSATIEILYRTMLDRGSDAGGKQDWLTRLSQGQTKVDIINGFCGSQEFIALCKSFGIEPGHVTVVEATAALDNALKAVKKTPESKMEVFENVSEDEDKATRSDESGKSVRKGDVNEEKAKKFVIRCYKAALNRDAGEAELTEWVNQIVTGTSTAETIVRGFLFSDEFKARNLSNEEIVKILYRIYMNRDADPEGLASWVANLAEGMSLEEVVKGFAGSSEFNSLLKDMRR